VDYSGAIVATGQQSDGRARIGQLPVGYYELAWGAPAASNRVSIGILAPLRAPTPLTSPIGIDVAMAWFFPQEAMAPPANLCALAGMNRVRDRLSWPELEPARGVFPVPTRYDASVRAQAAAGLQVLEVNHCSAAWANPNSKRFPLDLRDAYNFYRRIARRWAGQVEAVEPWNEADIEMFGGHTGSEMASLQKASYLGLKAGNPNVVACLNVLAIHRAATLQDFAANETWPYFDTFNLHHYDPLQNYPGLYADFRAVSAGRPLWVSECSVHVKWQGDERLRELSGQDLRLQAERLTKTFTLSLFEGASAVFYFMLPQYSEGQSQFGLLHLDLTPRPGFLALAAVGRLLADAKALGRMPLADQSSQAYFFDAKPDGQSADVAVAWSQGETNIDLPSMPRACYDCLGREHPLEARTLPLNQEPLFLVFGQGSRPELIPPPKPAPLLPGEPSTVVLQALLPEADIVLKESAYKIGPSHTKAVPVFVYNLGSSQAHGRLRVNAPKQWGAHLPGETFDLAPGDRKALTLNITCPATDGWNEAGLSITGDFGARGRPLLALRFVPGTPK